MSDPIDYFLQAELALAAYSNLSPGRPEPTVLAADMSSLEAEHFADSWTVVAQYTPTEQVPIFDNIGDVVGYITVTNGLSATVFERETVVDGVVTRQRYLAIRGTEITPSDIVTDIVD